MTTPIHTPPSVAPIASDIDTGELYDDIRMIVGDTVASLGAAVQHASQAFDDAENGSAPAPEWRDAITALNQALTRITDARDRIASHLRSFPAS